MSHHLDHIDQVNYIKSLSVTELSELAAEIREFLISVVLQNGGHFSGNLGVVELTVALHYFLDLKSDSLVWDVGHQSYPHKILTGRKDQIQSIRKQGGISGFPNIFESEFDSFGTGHSSTSISAILGMATADKLLGHSNEHVAVIGDGSLTGGMAWEALSNAGTSELPITIVINDNNIGIDPNQGAIGEYLNKLMQNGTGSNVFTDWNFEYFKIDDGHDMGQLLTCFEDVFRSEKPRIVHVRTVKGKGYADAEREQTKWHAVKYVKLPSLDGVVNGSNKGEKFQDIFGRKLLELAKQDHKVVGITPAMPSGSSFNFMMNEMPDRVFDVGIAEQHAVTFAAGLARKGLKPFCNIYSSFFQRGLDQFIHDVALQKLNVVFCLDRAGIVGEDGATHHGLYDLAMLRSIPDVTIAAPMDGKELETMMELGLEHEQGPFVIRYPRGRSSLIAKDYNSPKTIGEARQLKKGNEIAILSLGSVGDQAMMAHEILRQSGLEVSVYDMRFLWPLDWNLVQEVLSKYQLVVTLENATIYGGLGTTVSELHALQNSRAQLLSLGFPKETIGHAKPKQLFEEWGLDAESIATNIKHEWTDTAKREG